MASLGSTFILIISVWLGLCKGESPLMSQVFTDAYSATTTGSGSSKLNLLMNVYDNVCWVPSTATDPNDFVVINTKARNWLIAVATRGCGTFADEFVKSYKLEYSLDNRNWILYEEDGSVKIFAANNDSSTIVKHYLTSPLELVYLRLYPIEYNTDKGLQLEIFVESAECNYNLGIETFMIGSDQLSASSFKDSSHEPRHARITNTNVWCADPGVGGDVYLQVDLGVATIITGFFSRPITNNYGVMSYKVSHSLDATTWKDYKENGITKVFSHDGSYHAMGFWISESFKALHVRFTSLSRITEDCMGLELMGCRGKCRDMDVGMGDGRIPDGSLASSSTKDGNTPASNGRLRYTGGQSWCPSSGDATPYLEIDLGSSHIICVLATQGNPQADEWTTQFKIEFSVNGTSWQYFQSGGTDKVFTANSDRGTIVRQFLSNVLLAQYIRFRPVAWSGLGCLRTELFGGTEIGCQKTPVGLSVYGPMPGHHVTSTTFYSKRYGTLRSRLYSDFGWAAQDVGADNFIQLDLGDSYIISAVATMGNSVLGEWVTAYKLHYSKDGETWTAIQEGGTERVFAGNTASGLNYVKNTFSPVIMMFVKLIPTSYYQYLTIRIEYYGIKQDCCRSLGVEYKSQMDDSRITSSSNSDATHVASIGRLYDWRSGWCRSDATPSTDEYLQVDLAQTTHIAGFKVQKDKDHNYYTTSYDVWVGTSLSTWQQFTGITLTTPNEEMPEVHWLSESTTARYVRYIPKTWMGNGCMRVEVVGRKVTECSAAALHPPCDTLCVVADTDSGYQCLCNPGYHLDSDPHICSDIDECTSGSHTCAPSGGVCTNTMGSYTCACDSGYTGDGQICTDVDECSTGSHTCAPSGSTCTNNAGSFTCACNAGYTGDGYSCLDIDECSSGGHLCAPSGSTCTNTVGAFTCACNAGYTGDGVTCTDIDECSDGTNTCAPIGSSCTNNAGSYTCSCNAGYAGDGETCVEDIDECSSGAHTCAPSGSTCTNTVGSYTCACNVGYTGDGETCVDIDECSAGSHTCAPSVSTCTNTVGSFTCACNAGYTGDGEACTDIDECTDGVHTCALNGSTCTNTVGSYTCACNAGYTGNGETCADIDECSAGSHTCAPSGSTCTNNVGSYVCTCSTGYSGDGDTCTDIDECTGLHTCASVGSTCTNSVGSYSCSCNILYTGDGHTCTDLCSAENSCAPIGSSCTLTNDSYTCACNSGFLGDGYNCTEIDECVTGSHTCAVNTSTCTNNVGSFTCACNPGYNGDGHVCSDVDECSTGTSTCAPMGSVCTNTFGSHTCACISGFTGSGHDCNDINECAADIFPCAPSGSNCTNTMGSFTCSCSPGFIGDGHNCTDFDECIDGNHTCAPIGGNCTNTVGSYTCTCTAEYVGNGHYCSVLNTGRGTVGASTVTGAIAGGSVGGLFLIGAIVAAIFITRYRRKRTTISHRQPQDDELIAIEMIDQGDDQEIPKIIDGVSATRNNESKVTSALVHTAPQRSDQPPNMPKRLFEMRKYQFYKDLPPHYATPGRRRSFSGFHLDEKDMVLAYKSYSELSVLSEEWIEGWRTYQTDDSTQFTESPTAGRCQRSYSEFYPTTFSQPSSRESRSDMRVEVPSALVSALKKSQTFEDARNAAPSSPTAQVTRSSIESQASKESIKASDDRTNQVLNYASSETSSQEGQRLLDVTPSTNKQCSKASVLGRLSQESFPSSSSSYGDYRSSDEVGEPIKLDKFESQRRRVSVAISGLLSSIDNKTNFSILLGTPTTSQSSLSIQDEVDRRKSSKLTDDLQSNRTDTTSRSSSNEKVVERNASSLGAIGYAGSSTRTSLRSLSSDVIDNSLIDLKREAENFTPREPLTDQKHHSASGEASPVVTSTVNTLKSEKDLNTDMDRSQAFVMGVTDKVASLTTVVNDRPSIEEPQKEVDTSPGFEPEQASNDQELGRKNAKKRHGVFGFARKNIWDRWRKSKPDASPLEENTAQHQTLSELTSSPGPSIAVLSVEPKLSSSFNDSPTKDVESNAAARSSISNLSVRSFSLSTEDLKTNNNVHGPKGTSPQSVVSGFTEGSICSEKSLEKKDYTSNTSHPTSTETGPRSHVMYDWNSYRSEHGSPSTENSIDSGSERLSPLYSPTTFSEASSRASPTSSTTSADAPVALSEDSSISPSHQIFWTASHPSAHSQAAASGELSSYQTPTTNIEAASDTSETQRALYKSVYVALGSIIPELIDTTRKQVSDKRDKEIKDKSHFMSSSEVSDEEMTSIGRPESITTKKSLSSTDKNTNSSSRIDMSQLVDPNEISTEALYHAFTPGEGQSSLRAKESLVVNSETNSISDKEEFTRVQGKTESDSYMFGLSHSGSDGHSVSRESASSAFSSSDDMGEPLKLDKFEHQRKHVSLAIGGLLSALDKQSTVLRGSSKTSHSSLSSQGEVQKGESIKPVNPTYQPKKISSSVSFERSDKSQKEGGEGNIKDHRTLPSGDLTGQIIALDNKTSDIDIQSLSIETESEDSYIEKSSSSVCIVDIESENSSRNEIQGNAEAVNKALQAIDDTDREEYISSCVETEQSCDDLGPKKTHVKKRHGVFGFAGKNIWERWRTQKPSTEPVSIMQSQNTPPVETELSAGSRTSLPKVSAIKPSVAYGQLDDTEIHETNLSASSIPSEKVKSLFMSSTLDTPSSLSITSGSTENSILVDQGQSSKESQTTQEPSSRNSSIDLDKRVDVFLEKLEKERRASFRSASSASQEHMPGSLPDALNPSVPASLSIKKTESRVSISSDRIDEFLDKLERERRYSMLPSGSNFSSSRCDVPQLVTDESVISHEKASTSSATNFKESQTSRLHSTGTADVAECIQSASPLSSTHERKTPESFSESSTNGEWPWGRRRSPASSNDSYGKLPSDVPPAPSLERWNTIVDAIRKKKETNRRLSDSDAESPDYTVRNGARWLYKSDSQLSELSSTDYCDPSIIKKVLGVKSSKEISLLEKDVTTSESVYTSRSTPSDHGLLKSKDPHPDTLQTTSQDQSKSRSGIKASHSGDKSQVSAPLAHGDRLPGIAQAMPLEKQDTPALGVEMSNNYPSPYIASSESDDSLDKSIKDYSDSNSSGIGEPDEIDKFKRYRKRFLMAIGSLLSSIDHKGSPSILSGTSATSQSSVSTEGEVDKGESQHLTDYLQSKKTDESPHSTSFTKVEEISTLTSGDMERTGPIAESRLRSPGSGTIGARHHSMLNTESGTEELFQKKMPEKKEVVHVTTTEMTNKTIKESEHAQYQSPSAAGRNASENQEGLVKKRHGVFGFARRNIWDRWRRSKPNTSLPIHTETPSEPDQTQQLSGIAQPVAVELSTGTEMQTSVRETPSEVKSLSMPSTTDSSFNFHEQSQSVTSGAIKSSFSLKNSQTSEESSNKQELSVFHPLEDLNKRLDAFLEKVAQERRNSFRSTSSTSHDHSGSAQLAHSKDDAINPSLTSISIRKTESRVSVSSDRIDKFLEKLEHERRNSVLPSSSHFLTAKNIQDYEITDPKPNTAPVTSTNNEESIPIFTKVNTSMTSASSSAKVHFSNAASDHDEPQSPVNAFHDMKTLESFSEGPTSGEWSLKGHRSPTSSNDSYGKVQADVPPAPSLERWNMIVDAIQKKNQSNRRFSESDVESPEGYDVYSSYKSESQLLEAQSADYCDPRFIRKIFGIEEEFSRETPLVEEDVTTSESSVKTNLATYSNRELSKSEASDSSIESKAEEKKSQGIQSLAL
ncbi:uncharacterized protein LOC5504791 isoform X2 [Nematostella vectensis]|nr:uncharacterized protein LOC5504791 isoform X2 [Nematostella vectensis]